MKEQELEKLKIQYPEYNGKIANNAIDLTGKQYGNLLILYRTLNREDVTKTEDHNGFVNVCVKVKLF